jgi:hypothetical protein
MKREEDEKLWDLLGRATAPKISPFFARNVLRKIREARGEASASRWFNFRWLVPATGVAVAIIAALSLRLQVPDRSRSNSRPETLALLDAPDIELIADFDDLFGPDDNTSWDDAALL